MSTLGAKCSANEAMAWALSASMTARRVRLLASRGILPNAVASGDILAGREYGILWHRVYGCAFVEGSHMYAGKEVPCVQAVARAHRRTQARVMMQGITNGGHYFSHTEEPEGSVLRSRGA